jgi:hypothetical protein
MKTRNDIRWEDRQKMWRDTERMLLWHQIKMASITLYFLAFLGVMGFVWYKLIQILLS